MTQDSHSVSFPSRGPHVPEDKQQFLVKTPYGRALTLRSFPDGIVEHELVDWKRATSTSPSARPATLYSMHKFPSVQPNIGDYVVTQYGRGKVHKIEGNLVQVSISSWRLAGRSLVQCYLQKEHVRVLRPLKTYELSVFEKVEKAQELKVEANNYFVNKEYEQALQLYAAAIETVRYVQHTPHSTNEVRSDLLVVLVTCYNNAATCAVQLAQYDPAIKYTKNAIVLIEAMEDKKDGKIHKILVQEGFTDSKVFGEWKLKSYLVQARALAGQHDYDEALQVLQQQAPIVLQQYHDTKALQNYAKEVHRLVVSCIERRKEQKKKEKRRAQAMFASSSNESASSDNKSAETDRESSNDTESHQSMNGNHHDKDQNEPYVESDVDPKPVVSDDAPVTRPPGKMKKRVSFSETIGVKEITKEEPEWYEDVEVLTGLAVFVMSAGVAAYVVNRILFSSRN